MHIIIKLKKVLLIAAIPIFIAASCNKDGTKPCLTTAYNFAVTSEWTPQKEVYKLGDTIYLNSSFPKTLIDLTGNYNVDYSNSIGIGGDISIAYLDTITHQALPARDSFIVLSITGNFIERLSNKNSGINFSYVESSANYQFKGGFVCKKKGIYGIGVDNLASQGLKGKNCTNASLGMSITNTDKHLYLHQYALGVNPNDAFLQQHGYDFRVQ